MNVCGLVVEYNPFHNGHLYHARKAKKITKADVLIAVMSGPFLQRGEPALVDKFHRTKMALQSGIDLVIELPYAYAVQSSPLFAFGSIQSLYHIGANKLCFGSEAGSLTSFKNHYHFLQKNHAHYQHTLKKHLSQGLSYPVAHKTAYKDVSPSQSLDFSKPNNILGYSYVREILDHSLPIDLYTIQRIKNNYHDTDISSSIASATSIRNKLMEKNNGQMNAIEETLPKVSRKQLQTYFKYAKTWHNWELYFPYLQYRVGTMTEKELSTIEGVDEGIEYRIKKTSRKAVSFQHWVEQIKTKRYTWTRIQRMLLHILTNTKKQEMAPFKKQSSVPYVRILGMNQNGQTYLNKKKNGFSVPIVTRYQRNMHPLLQLEERATHTYYSIISPAQRYRLLQQEFKGPIRYI